MTTWKPVPVVFNCALDEAVELCRRAPPKAPESVWVALHVPFCEMLALPSWNGARVKAAAVVYGEQVVPLQARTW